MIKTYECVVLFSVQGSEADLQTAQDNFVQLVKKHNGKIVETEVWGKKFLAYAIDKQTEAFYNFYIIEMDTQELQAFDTDLRLTTSIIRYLTVTQDKKNDAKIATQTVEE